MQGFLEMFSGDNVDLWCEALRKDLNKPRQVEDFLNVGNGGFTYLFFFQEAITMEVEYNANVARHALRELDNWLEENNNKKKKE